ncbi:unnamed protein product [Peronospora farinosa]|uniref:Tyrosine-protein kinase ephrin type A/B receptor-like domain-containing protein n=1 Tax=Peronospora farinosa TaxID=134698 RepID=A0AAV0UXC5_9STRA|nr:unnamed protein product [Peronospora farinosa]CAI5740863.1 unnamed protein product [Peronospora farinosa]
MLLLVKIELIDYCASDEVMKMLSPFINLEALAEEAAKETTEDKGAARPVDTTYPLALVEMNALLQMYQDCRSQQSTKLRTWCIGNDKDPFLDEKYHHEEHCPRGILTHPCTGRVLHSNSSVNKHDIEFLWRWKGIQCDIYTDPTTVTHIYLPGESLTCELANVDLSVMVSLEQLDLSDNQLYGGFPAWLGDMTMLRLLNVANNKLTGDIPPSFAGNDALELINVSGNGLSASTLGFFDAFHRLQHLDLSSNTFAMELSSNLFSSPFLRTINLSNNAFDGELTQLPIFQYIESFDVSSNLLTGTIPPELSLWGREDPHDPDENSSLAIIDLYNNFFTGDLSVLSNQSVLQRCDVHDNNFGGFLPEFPPSLLDFIKPSMFDGNAFMCPIPVTLLPSNLTCICGNGHTITSNLVTELSRHEKVTARVPANRATEICVPCYEGLYSNATTNQKCLPCPAGAVPSKEADHCKPCLPGSFSNVSGAQFCSPCSHGKFADGIGAALCSPCNPGQFAADQGSTKCDECPVGTYSELKGEKVCTPCPAGTYASAKGEAECLMCSKGTYQDVAGSADCKACPIGYIAPHQGHAKCSPCSPGSFYDALHTTCTLCHAGTFTGTPAQTECIKCENGTVAEGFGNDKCLSVAIPELGYTTTNTALKCGSGTFNDGTWRTCQPCPPGTFAPNSSSRMCSSCAKGSFAFNNGSSYCNLAPPGSFVQVEGAIRAEPCPPNHYAAKNGSITCTQCQLPSFSFLPGGSKCILAKPGEVYDHVTWPSFALNLAGVEQHDLLTKRSQVSPIDVLIQTWTETLTSYSGLNCSLHVLRVHQPLGSAELTEIIVAVEITTPVSPKTRIDNTLEKGVSDAIHQATKAAENALNDLFDELNRSDTKEPKDIDQVAALMRSNSFQNALVRQFRRTNLLTGALPLIMVNVSLVEPSFRSTRAVACAAGTFFTVIDKFTRKCQLCPVGSYSSTSGALKCKPCPRGTFSAKEGMESCTLCPLGADAAPGASSCVECSWLTYECKGFWQDLIIAVGIAAGVLHFLYKRMRQLCMGDQAQRQQDDSVALMAAIRAHGRTLDGVRYAPMGMISADTMLGIFPGTENVP